MAGPNNWDNVKTWQRVIAAIIASGVKLDLKSIATYYGTTYDTLENRFRKIKKEAAVLKAEVDAGDRGEVAPPRKSAPSTPRKPKTPSKKEALNAVANGRVTKPTSTKKKAIKQEQNESYSESFFDEATDSNFSSFNHAMSSFDANSTGLFGGDMDFEE